MPPGYKPLPVKIQGSGMEQFFEEPTISYEDAKNAAMARASNEIKLRAQQRQEQQQNQYESELGQITDLSQGLEIIKKLAIQMGDTDTAINVERVQNQRRGEAPLSQAVRDYLNGDQGALIPNEATAADVRLKTGLGRFNLSSDINNDPTRIQGRELDNTLKEQRATGTQVRSPTAAQAKQVGATDAFVADMDRVIERYSPYIPENRGVRLVESLSNPNSAAARFVQRLTLSAKSAALALESRVTEQDYQIIKELTVPGPLDTYETMLDKAQELKTYIKSRNEAEIAANEAGGYNMKGIKNRPKFTIPKAGYKETDTIPSEATETDEEQAYKARHKAAYLAQLRAKGGL